MRRAQVAEVDVEGVAEMQAEIRYILSEVVHLAERGGFRLFAAYGTVLGAIRDQSLIPWDIDADVWVPTERYADFCAYLRENLPPTLRLLAPESDPGYEYLFARVAPRGVDHKLVYIDMFPLAGAPSTRVGQRLYTVAVRSLVQAFLMKRVRLPEMLHYSRRKRLVARLAHGALTPVPDGLIMAAYQRIVARFDSPTAATLTNPCGSYQEREFFDSRWFSGTTPVQLSGITLPAPSGYDALLTLIYGNYMRPIDKDAQQAELTHATRYFVRPLKRQGWSPGHSTAGG